MSLLDEAFKIHEDDVLRAVLLTLGATLDDRPATLTPHPDGNGFEDYYVGGNPLMVRGPEMVVQVRARGGECHVKISGGGRTARGTISWKRVLNDGLRGVDRFAAGLHDEWERWS